MIQPEDIAFAAWKAQPSAKTEGALYKELHRFASILVWKRLGRRDPELATNIVHQAFEKIKQFRGDSQFSTWFYKLAFNMIGHEIRRVKKLAMQTSDEFLENSPDSSRLPDRELLTKELLASIEEPERTILRGRLDGRNREEVAKELGVSLETLKSKWRKLRSRLTKKLG